MKLTEIIQSSAPDSSAGGSLEDFKSFLWLEQSNKIKTDLIVKNEDSEKDSLRNIQFIYDEAHAFLDGPTCYNMFYPNIKVCQQKLTKGHNLLSFTATLQSNLECELQKEERSRVFGLPTPKKFLQLMALSKNSTKCTLRCVALDFVSSPENDDKQLIQSFQNVICSMKLKPKTDVVLDSENMLMKLLENLEENGAAGISLVKNELWENNEFSNGILCQKDPSHLKYRIVNSNNSKSKKHFAIIMYVLSEVYQLLITGLTCTERELYYKERELIANQAALHSAITDVCRILNASPWELGIRQSCKGLICGAIKMHMSDNSIIDCYCNDHATLIPNDIQKIRFIETTAKFVLIVEKDTIFQKFVVQNILLNLHANIILITGKGYPDVGTRLMVKRIWDNFHLPIYVLVDADPFGIEIMFIYRYGSKAMAVSADRLACPQIRWIGIQPSEIELLAIPTIAQSKKDKMKIIELLQRTYINSDVRNELEILRRLGRKAEIEAVAGFSQNFLLYDYIPNKFKRNLVI